MVRNVSLLIALALTTMLAASPSPALDWSELSDLPTPRFRLAAVLWNGQIFVIGGQGPGSLHCTPRVDAYDLRTRTWQRKSDAPMELCGHAAVSYRGRIYVFGGYVGARGSDRFLIYDPRADAWTSGGSMPSARTAHTAAAAGNGRIYVFGGYDSGPALATTDEYDVENNTWRSAAAMPGPRTALAAAVGCDGVIYALGGHGPSTTQGGTTSGAAFGYDISANRWTVLSEMPEPRGDLAAARGLDGRIYAIGGIFDRWETADVQIYDPSTDSWSIGPSLRTARQALAAVTVGNRIFAVGGFSKFGGPLAAHEALGPIPRSRSCTSTRPTGGVSGPSGSVVSHSRPTIEMNEQQIPSPGGEFMADCDDRLRNGGFEEPQLAPGRSYDDRLSGDAVPGWTLTRGDWMELQRDVFGAGAAKEGDQYLEIASTGPTTIYQEVAVTKGATYQLKGFYSPRPKNASNDIGIAIVSGRSDVRWRLAASGAGSKGAPLRWEEFELEIVADDDVLTVAFRDQSTPNAAGGFLDGIRLCRQ